MFLCLSEPFLGLCLFIISLPSLYRYFTPLLLSFRLFIYLFFLKISFFDYFFYVYWTNVILFLYLLLMFLCSFSYMLFSLLLSHSNLSHHLSVYLFLLLHLSFSALLKSFTHLFSRSLFLFLYIFLLASTFVFSPVCFFFFRSFWMSFCSDRPVTVVGRYERIFKTLIDYFLFIIYKSTATTDIKMYRSTKLEKNFFIRSKIRFSFHWLGLEKLTTLLRFESKLLPLKRFINDELIHQNLHKGFFFRP